MTIYTIENEFDEAQAEFTDEALATTTLQDLSGWFPDHPLHIEVRDYYNLGAN